MISLGGLTSVVLSGMGEPFTHPDVYALNAAAKRRGLALTVVTNLISADLERVLSLGVDQLPSKSTECRRHHAPDPRS